MLRMIVLCACLLQEGPDVAGKVADLVQKLRSDEAAERNDASKKLREIGKPAMAALKDAAKDEDLDLATRAREILANIEADQNPVKRLRPDDPLVNKTAPAEFKALFSTSKGEFTVKVTREWAPRGADRFYNLVNTGFYNDCRFFRVIKDFMGQFGIHADPEVAGWWKQAKIEDDPVKQGNKRGRITFATAGKNTRTTQLFINFRDNDRLDAMGFAAFGEVIEGMNVVDALNSEYGEGAPRGNGPNQARIQTEGNDYLKKEFERLDYIKSAKILP